MFVVCDECGRTVLSSNARYIERYGVVVCDDCFSELYIRCACCDEIIRPEDAHYVDSYGINVCGYCYESYFAVCEVCGSVFDTSEMIFIEEEGAWYCEECYEELVRIRSYNYKPAKWIFRKCDDEQKPLYMGVELEIDAKGHVNRCKLIDKLRTILGDVVLFKRDGSLSKYGFEIVSHPCSLKYHKEQVNWQDAFKVAIEHGYRSHDIGYKYSSAGCGLHISVPKPSEVEIAKAILFFEKHWSKVLLFSRRTEYQYKRWCDRYLSEGIDVEKVQKIIKGQCDKYKAINISKPDVMEFRIFRGTLNIVTFYASLEFVHNLMKYIECKSLEDILKANWNDFVSWCMEHGEVEYLVDYMRQRKLM